ncbi:hypothetical protein R5W23_000411 [Gemmata sp. JC673]|uniref:Type II toxin-antitoxin system RelE/ParE family toxin n=1 Tax=Gemmata algarum TaxID=2975278 RepID=A0ABU5EW06_9BACT|nr:hypothetical protein [Gemmata algarum]MDY3559419.1 hypothetical protein [Gemmata algarum]
MTFTVTWRLTATLEVSRIEAAADDPAVVRAAAARIDWVLRRTPRDMGESRDQGYLLWYEDVLGVYYRVDDNNLRVDVLYAGPSRRR